MKDQIVTVAELFQNELDAINNYIVLIENKKKITTYEKKELKKLKVVANYLVERLQGDTYVNVENLTIH
tara:strand:- start:1399 stop:1605 length:207 start_codon:yes stop_codon:yes gene_type:complete